MRATFSRKLGHALIARFNYDAAFSFAMVAAGFATVVHLIWFLSSFLGFRHRLDTATMVIVDWDSSIFTMHIRIGVALLIGVAGLLSRRVVGLFMSVLAFAWVSLEYVDWYVWSVRLKSSAGIESFPPPTAHAFGLYGATAWNIVVLALVIAVLVWDVRQLIRIVKSEAIQWPDRSEIGR